MTINSETRVAGPFEGNDSTVTFPFTFKVFDSDELLVVRAADAEETVLVLGADYSVTLNPDQNASPGGSVTLIAPLATNSTLTLTSDLEFLQPLDLTNQGGFYPRVINNAFDRVTILLQQLRAITSRTLKFPLSDGAVGDLPGRAARAGSVLAFDNATGEPIVGPNIAQLGTVAAGLEAIGIVASNIGDVNTVADNVADITNFADVYYGSNATDPTVRRDGGPLQSGDLYFNTSLNELRVYDGTQWRNSVSGTVTVQNLSGNGVQTSFPLDYAPESEIITQIFIHGVYQQKNTYELGGVGGSTLIFDTAPPAGTDNIEVVVSSLSPSDAALRGDLESPGGASFVNGAMQYAANYAAIRALPFAKIKAVTALGSLNAGDGGHGVYYPDPADTTSADNGGSILVTADGGRLKLVQSTPHRLSQFSAVCDGVANDSVAMQKLIDANKGKTVIIDRGTPMIAGVSLIGASYDHTQVICAGGELKLAPDSGSTFGGAWIGILVKDCNFVKINAKFNGNQSAMTMREQIFCIASAGSQDFDSDFLTFRNIRGDGLYVSQSDWFAASNPTRRMSLGKVTGYNATDSGRNTVSIISVSGLTIGEVTSYQVGGLMNGVWQPGGIDIEPDQGYHVCEDISVGVAHIVTAGTSGIGILGKAYTNDATGDWNTARISFDSFNLVITRAGSSGLAATRWFDLKLKGQVTYAVGVRGIGCSIAAGSRLQADIKTKGTTYGLRLGAGIAIQDFDIKAICNDYSGAGIRTSLLTRGAVSGRCGGSPGGSTSFGVECHNEGVGGAQQINVRYSVDAPYDNVAARAFRNDPSNPVAYVLTTVGNCDWSGYASPSVTCDAVIFCENVRGYTELPGMPANGAWVTGMYVRKSNPSPSAGKILLGWVRLTNGTGNVLNTDWSAAYATTT